MNQTAAAELLQRIVLSLLLAMRRNKMHPVEALLVSLVDNPPSEAEKDLVCGDYFRIAHLMAVESRKEEAEEQAVPERCRAV